jgi:chromosome segregation ATPase
MTISLPENIDSISDPDLLRKMAKQLQEELDREVRSAREQINGLQSSLTVANTLLERSKSRIDVLTGECADSREEVFRLVKGLVNIYGEFFEGCDGSYEERLNDISDRIKDLLVFHG